MSDRVTLMTRTMIEDAEPASLRALLETLVRDTIIAAEQNGEDVALVEVRVETISRAQAKLLGLLP